MDIKDLETILLYFYDNRDKYHYFKDFNEKFKNKSLSNLEIQAAIQKLVKDGFIIEEEQLHTIRNGSEKNIKEQYKAWGWFISYDGIFLIDTLPNEFKRQPYVYLNNIENKKKRAGIVENIPKKYWWLYNPVAFVLPLIIGIFIGEQKSDGENIINVTKTKVDQNMPKKKATLDTPHQNLDSQKNLKDDYEK